MHTHARVGRTADFVDRAANLFKFQNGKTLYKFGGCFETFLMNNFSNYECHEMEQLNKLKVDKNVLCKMYIILTRT